MLMVVVGIESRCRIMYSMKKRNIRIGRRYSIPQYLRNNPCREGLKLTIFLPMVHLNFNDDCWQRFCVNPINFLVVKLAVHGGAMARCVVSLDTNGGNTYPISI